MPVTFVSRIAFQSASVISSVGTRLVTPAAATTTSTCPNASRQASRRAAQRGQVADVGRMPQRPPPRASIAAGHLVDGVGAPARWRRRRRRRPQGRAPAPGRCRSCRRRRLPCGPSDRTATPSARRPPRPACGRQPGAWSREPSSGACALFLAPGTSARGAGDRSSCASHARHRGRGWPDRSGDAPRPRRADRDRPPARRSYGGAHSTARTTISTSDATIGLPDAAATPRWKLMSCTRNTCRS